MSEANPIRIFVAHVFSEHPEYLRVFEYLESRPNFFYRNCSAPDARPPAGDGEAVRQELRRQISLAEIVVLPVGVFALDPVLVTYQADVARRMGKPVLAIKAFGETLVLKKALLDKADDMVDWNDRSITDAIKRLARKDSAGQWEVIDFKLD